MLVVAFAVVGIVAHAAWAGCLAWMIAIVAIFVKLHVSVKENAASQKTALNEAGKALTDTLKIAFDGIKKVSHENSRHQQKINELTRRLGTLEQQVGVIARHRKETITAPQQEAPKTRESQKESKGTYTPPLNKLPPPPTKYTEAINPEKK